MSTLKVNTIQNTAGVEVYTAKAWVNFNGTGTPSIRSSGNVSSITDNGLADYSVNFAVAMPDTSYATFGTAKWEGADYAANGVVTLSGHAAQTASSVRFFVKATNEGASAIYDPTVCNIVVFR